MSRGFNKCAAGLLLYVIGFILAIFLQLLPMTLWEYYILYAYARLAVPLCLILGVGAILESIWTKRRNKVKWVGG